MIKSKAPVSMEEMGEQFALIGPYNESCVRTEVELLEPHHHVMREVLDEMRAHGIKVNEIFNFLALCFRAFTCLFLHYAKLELHDQALR